MVVEKDDNHNPFVDDSDDEEEARQLTITRRTMHSNDKTTEEHASFTKGRLSPAHMEPVEPVHAHMRWRQAGAANRRPAWALVPHVGQPHRARVRPLLRTKRRRHA